MFCCEFCRIIKHRRAIVFQIHIVRDDIACFF
jgi:hypothetical protein